MLAKESKLGGLLQTNVFLCSKPNFTNACSLLRGGRQEWEENQRVKFLKEISLCLHGYVFPCFTTTNTTAKQQNKKESQTAFSIYFLVWLSAVQWTSLWSRARALAATALMLQTATAKLCGCPLHSGCATSSYCPSAAGLIPRRRRGNTIVVVMDVVSYQKCSSLSHGLLVLAFILFKFALDLSLSFSICYLLS